MSKMIFDVVSDFKPPFFTVKISYYPGFIIRIRLCQFFGEPLFGCNLAKKK